MVKIITLICCLLVSPLIVTNSFAQNKSADAQKNLSASIVADPMKIVSVTSSGSVPQATRSTQPLQLILPIAGGAKTPAPAPVLDVFGRKAPAAGATGAAGTTSPTTGIVLH